MDNPEEPSKPHSSISHMPFAASAIEQSVTEMVGEGEVPDFSDGYNDWLSAFEEGDAGVYTITVRESVEVMEETVDSGNIENDG